MKNSFKLIALHNTKQILEIYAHIFLSIYFFNLVNGNISMVILFWLIHSSSNIIFRYAFSKLINSKRILVIYRISIFLNFIDVVILLLMKSNLVNYIYLYALIYNFGISMYWTCYEIMISNVNSSNEYKTFFSINKVIENIINILVPICLGFIIAKTSFTISFFVLLITTLLVFFLSIFLNKIEINVSPINLVEYKDKIKNKKLYKKVLIQNIIDGFTTEGAASLLASLIIYSQLSNAIISGAVSSGTYFIGIIFAIIYARYITKNNFGKTVIPITIIILILTMFCTFNSSIIFILLYTLINELGVVFTDLMGTSITYESFENITYTNYINDYLWSIQLFYDFGRILAYGFVFIICMSYPELNKLAFVVFSVGFIIRAIIIKVIIKKHA